MKLATLKDGTRDGRLLIVSADLTRAVPGPSQYPTMQSALDNWTDAVGALQGLADRLAQDPKFGEKFDEARCHAPLPRAYEWVDGSAYINHIVLVRKARGAEPPETLRSDPLVYQGGSSHFLGPRDPISVRDLAWGCDFESEVCVVLGDTPEGTSARDAKDYVRLVMLANDVSLRNLIPEELAKGFGFFCSKPATAFSPVAVTPDELGDAWRGGRLHLKIETRLNGTLFGDPDAGPEMHFSFLDLIGHITKTRRFGAGTILGSGTVSNQDRARGSSCIAERRMIEKLDGKSSMTPFLQYGDVVEIMIRDQAGNPIFGTIRQEVVRETSPSC